MKTLIAFTMIALLCAGCMTKPPMTTTVTQTTGADGQTVTTTVTAVDLAALDAQTKTQMQSAQLAWQLAQSAYAAVMADKQASAEARAQAQAIKDAKQAQYVALIAQLLKPPTAPK